MDGLSMSTIKLLGSTLLDGKSFEFDLNTMAHNRISIIGPNGAGKSTLLRIIGGHQPLNSGILQINGKTIDSPNDRIFIPPHKRPTVLQHQNGCVFPYLSVQDNVAFPFRSLKCSKREARTKAAEILERFDLKKIQTRLPQTLSGGQNARVALARSIASNPSFLLLDEPCSSLDIESISEIHRQLQHLKTTLLIVSHDPIETMKLTNFIIAIENGKVVQQGKIHELTSNPASTWISKFLDLNLVSGNANGYDVRILEGGSLNLSSKYYGPIHISFPVSAISLHTQRPTGSPRNKWKATVSSLDIEEDLVRVGLTGPFYSRAKITNASFKELGLELGSQCWASIKATELMVLPSMDPAKN
ncbi:MAG: ABC transporter ATP-binding protein [Acidimicrobiaceae bacterium]|nr:ABC transporter ATP-binding protein [Acidimicrobiaceae bacterium]